MRAVLHGGDNDTLCVDVCSYDALLASGDSWHELCMRAVLHGGDNDSTGAIACAWFGVLHGFSAVPQSNYKVSRFMYRFMTF